MLISPNPTTYSLLKYWHEGLWRSIFNRLPFSSSELLSFTPVDRQEIVTGCLSAAMSATNVWIAPFVFENKMNTSESWIPLWMPAVVDGGQIKIRQELALPWIPASQFDKTKSYSPFSEPLHAYDDWLQNDCLTEDNTLQWQSWQVFYQASMVLLDKLSDGTWQENLAQRGLVLVEKSLIADEALLFSLKPELTQTFSQQLAKKEISPVLAQFAQIEEGEPEGILDIAGLLENAHLICGALSPRLFSESEYSAVIHAMNLEQGKFLAIKTPIGTQKSALVETIVGATMVQKLLSTASFPDIYLLTQNKEIPTIECSVAPKNSDIAIESVKLAYENLKQGIELVKLAHACLSDEAFDLEENQSIEEYIACLQERDEKGELALNKVLNKQGVARAKASSHIIKRLLKWVFQRKATRIALEAAQKEISDKIRKIKVKRTKIHQTLVQAVDALNTRKSLQRQWESWFQAQGIPDLPIATNLNDDLRFIQGAIAHKIFSLSFNYWRDKLDSPAQSSQSHSSDPIKGWSLLKLQLTDNRLRWEPCDVPSHCELLIIDQSNRLHPQEIAPLLALSSRALFLGDNQDLPPHSILSPFLEESALAGYQLEDDEVIEQLHYKGLLLSVGNAFTVALTNNSRQACEYGAYLSTLKIEKMSAPTVALTHVAGKSEQSAGSMMNVAEVSAIVHWLKTGPVAHEQAQIMVITPFCAQKELLISSFKAEGIMCPVHLLDELSTKEWTQVVFSPVYTATDRRPFMFDQGEHFLYSALARAKKGFWILGDSRIFDAKMHSPSGKLAKLLFKSEVMVEEFAE